MKVGFLEQWSWRGEGDGSRTQEKGLSFDWSMHCPSQPIGDKSNMKAEIQIGDGWAHGNQLIADCICFLSDKESKVISASE